MKNTTKSRYKVTNNNGRKRNQIFLLFLVVVFLLFLFSTSSLFDRFVSSHIHGFWVFFSCFFSLFFLHKIRSNNFDHLQIANVYSVLFRESEERWGRCVCVYVFRIFAQANERTEIRLGALFVAVVWIAYWRSCVNRVHKIAHWLKIIGLTSFRIHVFFAFRWSSFLIFCIASLLYFVFHFGKWFFSTYLAQWRFSLSATMKAATMAIVIKICNINNTFKATKRVVCISNLFRLLEFSSFFHAKWKEKQREQESTTLYHFLTSIQYSHVYNVTLQMHPNAFLIRAIFFL